MNSLLFIHSQTLYSRVTIPMALGCLEKGWDVTFLVNRPVLFGRSAGFSEEFIKRCPTTVGVLNPEAYNFVADLIGMGDEWRAAQGKVRFSLSGAVYPKRFDAVIGTTKNMNMLHDFASKGIPSFALGYQHLPVFTRVGGLLAGPKDDTSKQSVFFTNNAFSRQHDFGHLIQGCDFRLNAFTFLDVVHSSRPAEVERNDLVLIFHPGGYRDVISTAGDNKDTCYVAQSLFLERLCIPLVEQGLTPVIKVHPLRAQYHDLEDLDVLVRQIECKYGLADGSIELIGPKDWFWDVAFRSAFILTFGSSAIYELWSAGLKNVFVCNFEGQARSSKFTFFKSICINSIESYRELTSEQERYVPTFDSLTEEVFSAYNILFNGCAVVHAKEMIA